MPHIHRKYPDFIVKIFNKNQKVFRLSCFKCVSDAYLNKYMFKRNNMTKYPADIAKLLTSTVSATPLPSAVISIPGVQQLFGKPFN